MIMPISRADHLPKPLPGNNEIQWPCAGRNPGRARWLAVLGLCLVFVVELPAEPDGPRVTSTVVSLPTNHGSGGSNYFYTGAMNDGAPAPKLLFRNKRAFLVWNDAEGNGRISLLKSDLSAIEKEVLRLRNRKIADAVSDERGFALLSIEWSANGTKINQHTAHLEAYTESGVQRFSIRIVGTLDYKKVGDQGIDTEFGTFNLTWSGEQYATYFNTMRKWDDGVVHQSEYLALFDGDGKRSPLGWTWNVSHSFRPRIAWDGKRFQLSTVGDVYPRAFVSLGFPDGSRKEIEVPKAAPGETYQYVPISNGDIYGENGEVWMVFDSKVNRSDYDIGLLRAGEQSDSSSIVWITNSSIRERIPRIIPFGQSMLLVWAVDKGGNDSFKGWFPRMDQMQTQLCIIDRNGSVQKAPFNIKARIRGATRLFSFPNGDAGWVNDLGTNPGSLEIVRVSMDGAEATDTSTELTDNESPNITIENQIVQNEGQFDESLSLPLLRSAYDGNADEVRSLLRQGADPNAANEGWRALHYAAFAGHLDVCKALIEGGANPDLPIQGWSAMQLAETEGHQEVVEYLKSISKATRALPYGRRPLPPRFHQQKRSLSPDPDQVPPIQRNLPGPPIQK